MVEVVCGVDVVIVNESNEFIERMENGDLYMINLCCLVFLSYI